MRKISHCNYSGRQGTLATMAALKTAQCNINIQLSCIYSTSMPFSDSVLDENQLR